MKNIAGERLSLLTFLSCSKKVSQTAGMLFEIWNGFQCAQHMLWRQSRYSQISKTITDDGAKVLTTR
jgi:hypothetical protein